MLLTWGLNIEAELHYMAVKQIARSLSNTTLIVAIPNDIT